MFKISQVYKEQSSTALNNKGGPLGYPKPEAESKPEK